MWSKVRNWVKSLGPAAAPQNASLPEGKQQADDPSRAADAGESEGSGNLVERMIQQGRFALLLRPQIVENLDDDQRNRAVEALEEEMALVPEGNVLLSKTEFTVDAVEAAEAGPGHLVHVDALYLDRYPVTNRQFRQFVLAGGYEEPGLWDPEILPGVLDFVDRTGEPGPLHWLDGNYPEGKDDHPVTGISWYEASAYASWVGKRLASDPEWVKAGSWPVPMPGGAPSQRKYPWGDSMDRQRANLWGSGPGHPVPVSDYEEGVSVGGVYGLIGNVWEWTTTRFGAWQTGSAPVEPAMPMKSIRGGSYDTYFDNHATCQFQSGDSPLARKRNIGFRCALGICDLAPLQELDEPVVAAEV